jgi:adenine phosphoribosyltransferase
MKLKEVKKYIRDIPDFPKKGIIFRDITPLLNNPVVFKFVVDTLAKYFKHKNVQKVLSIEARGFIFGSMVAYKLNCGFVPVRKKGKLPYKTISIEYELEYGKDVLEIHQDAINPQENVVIIDDVLATGGTAYALAKLAEKCGSKVIGLGFVIELTYLNPKEKLKDYEVFSIVKY